MSTSVHLHVGIDVSAKELHAAKLRRDEEKAEQRVFHNTPTGHLLLITWVQTGATGPARVVLEATGIYSLNVALALHGTDGIEVMVANPRAVKNYAKALMQRGKSDMRDAVLLVEFAKRMPFVPWQPPSQEALHLRSVVRRIHSLKKELASEKNRRHSNEYNQEAHQMVLNDVEIGIANLELRIKNLEGAALELIRAQSGLARALDLITSIKGFAETSATQVLAEIACLPVGMDVRQLVAYAGLDPQPDESGTSKNPPWKISKKGNRYLREALFHPALVATRFEPVVQAFYEHLLKNGKKKMQGIVAVMRKLLHAIHGMLKHDAPFDGSKFYRPQPKAA